MLTIATKVPVGVVAHAAALDDLAVHDLRAAHGRHLAAHVRAVDRVRVAVLAELHEQLRRRDSRVVDDERRRAAEVVVAARVVGDGVPEVRGARR